MLSLCSRAGAAQSGLGGGRTAAGDGRRITDLEIAVQDRWLALVKERHATRDAVQQLPLHEPVSTQGASSAAAARPRCKDGMRRGEARCLKAQCTQAQRSTDGVLVADDLLRRARLVRRTQDSAQRATG